MNGNNGLPQSEAEATQAAEDGRDNMRADDDGMSEMESLFQGMPEDDLWAAKQDEERERVDAYVIDYLRNFTVDMQAPDGRCIKVHLPLQPIAEALANAGDYGNLRIHKALEDRDLKRVQMLMFEEVMDHLGQQHRGGEL